MRPERLLTYGTAMRRYDFKSQKPNKKRSPCGSATAPLAFAAHSHWLDRRPASAQLDRGRGDLREQIQGGHCCFAHLCRSRVPEGSSARSVRIGGQVRQKRKKKQKRSSCSSRLRLPCRLVVHPHAADFAHAVHEDVMIHTSFALCAEPPSAGRLPAGEHFPCPAAVFCSSQVRSGERGRNPRS